MWRNAPDETLTSV
jgi:hypothetical protein